ncbi:hypothetical protein PybrP1_012184 [[Pythium] brassicae (nom. inval.)]|nr:hypothetical protein PybrP1_012184 [[Pythium] brassicae (nom. inval.)]
MKVLSLSLSLSLSPHAVIVQTHSRSIHTGSSRGLCVRVAGLPPGVAEVRRREPCHVLHADHGVGQHGRREDGEDVRDAFLDVQLPVGHAVARGLRHESLRVVMEIVERRGLQEHGHEAA